MFSYRFYKGFGKKVNLSLSGALNSYLALSLSGARLSLSGATAGLIRCDLSLSGVENELIRCKTELMRCKTELMRCLSLSGATYDVSLHFPMFLPELIRCNL